MLGDIFGGIASFGGKIVDKIWPDKMKLQEKNLEINAETEKQSGGKMTPRKFLMYVLCILITFEVMARPIIVTYWPETTLPPPTLELVMQVASAMFGMGL